MKTKKRKGRNDENDDEGWRRVNTRSVRKFSNFARAVTGHAEFRTILRVPVATRTCTPSWQKRKQTHLFQNLILEYQNKNKKQKPLLRKRKEERNLKEGREKKKTREKVKTLPKGRRWYNLRWEFCFFSRSELGEKKKKKIKQRIKPTLFYKYIILNILISFLLFSSSSSCVVLCCLRRRRRRRRRRR